MILSQNWDQKFEKRIKGIQKIVPEKKFKKL